MAIFNYKDPEREFEKLLEKVKKQKGVLVINWHNNRFDKKDFPNAIPFYKMMLRRFKKDKAFVSGCRDVLKKIGEIK